MADSVNGQWQYTLGFDKCGIESQTNSDDYGELGGASKFSMDRSYQI